MPKPILEATTFKEAIKSVEVKQKQKLSGRQTQKLLELFLKPKKKGSGLRKDRSKNLDKVVELIRQARPRRGFRATTKAALSQLVRSMDDLGDAADQLLAAVDREVEAEQLLANAEDFVAEFTADNEREKAKVEADLQKHTADLDQINEMMASFADPESPASTAPVPHFAGDASAGLSDSDIAVQDLEMDGTDLDDFDVDNTGLETHQKPEFQVKVRDFHKKLRKKSEKTQKLSAKERQFLRRQRALLREAKGVKQAFMAEVKQLRKVKTKHAATSRGRTTAREKRSHTKARSIKGFDALITKHTNAFNRSKDRNPVRAQIIATALIATLGQKKLFLLALKKPLSEKTNLTRAKKQKALANIDKSVQKVKALEIQWRTELFKLKN